jgi:hypothetical protein
MAPTSPLPDAAMTSIPEAGWLFTRGSESVRLVREENSKACRLFLYRPGTDVVIHEFADVTECMKRQAEIEQHLLAAGYHFAQPSGDRRSEPGTWHRPDRRRDDDDHRLRSA